MSLPYHPRPVRVFLVVLAVLGVGATLKWGPAPGPARTALLAGTALLAAFFIAVPKLFFPVYRILTVGAGYLGNVVFLVLSAAVFFLVLTPMSLVRRLLGKRFIPTSPDPGAASYLEDKAEAGPLERLF